MIQPIIRLERADVIPLVEAGKAKPRDYSNVTELSLLVDATSACQLACGYCYYGSKGCKLMDPEKLYSALTKFIVAFGSQVKKVKVHYMGGEPLIAWDRILELNHKMRDFCEVSQLYFYWSLTSNLVALDQEKSDLMIKEGAGIHCSVDGPKIIQDQNRPFRSGKGSFETVDRNIPLALAITPNDTARATITPFSAHHLPEITEYFFDKGFKTVGLFPAHNLEWKQEDFDAWEKGIRKAYEIAVARNGEIASVLRGNPHKELRFGYCGAGKGLWAFDSQGVLYDCHHLTNHLEYAMIDAAEASPEMIKEALLAKSFSPQRIPIIPEKCQACSAKSYCGGGCWAENLTFANDAYLPEPNSCVFKQITFESLKDALTEPADDNNRDEIYACWLAKVCCMISCDEEQNSCSDCHGYESGDADCCDGCHDGLHCCRGHSNV